MVISPSTEASEETDWTEVFEEKFHGIETPTIRVKDFYVVQANRRANRLLQMPVGEKMTDIFDIDGGFGEGSYETCPVVNDGEAVGNHISGARFRLLAIPSFWDSLGVVIYAIPQEEEELDFAYESVTPEDFSGTGRLSEFDEEQRRYVENKSAEYVQRAEKEALSAIMRRFNNSCEENDTRELPKEEIEAVVQALLQIGMVFSGATELMQKIIDRSGLGGNLKIICGRLIHVN
ncbi:hypothetical protein [Salinibacter ruber]|uniref:Uncharacterized protein n=1 Tax=Salinibacter ruber TaxID=146919 RepID=A0A9X2Q4U7_9BACT|nr:hypothetical protein [Salinibacter ruber]MCS3661752.1 hypothetical protein [Salinibacter ruber]MCS3711587.1 hypothetical protein [Salinibacter ruber]